MPWYKFTSSHGPGHMSQSESYRYYDHKLADDERRYEWEEWARDWHDNVGDVDMVKRIPAAVRDRKLRSGLWALKSAVRELQDRHGIKVKIDFPQADLDAVCHRIDLRLQREARAAKRRQDQRTKEVRARNGW